MTIATYKWHDDRVLEISSDDFDLRIRKRVWEPRYERYSSFVSAPRIYVQVGDFNLLENLENRRRRPYTEFRKYIERVVWPTLGWQETAPKLGWRQNAGCSMCPCSPGFVVQVEGWQPVESIGARFDMWLDIKTPDFVSVDERKPAMVPVLI
jgi:hypothetical protein